MAQIHDSALRSRHGLSSVIAVWPALFLCLLASPLFAVDQVPDGGNVPTYIGQGKYDLVLLGDATWNSQVTIGSAQSGLRIDGGGHTIRIGAANISALRNFTANNSISITDTTFTFGNSVATNDYLLGFATEGITSNLYLDGTTFTGFNRTANRGGSVLFAYAARDIINIDGGINGVTFDSNRAEWDAGGAMAVSYATVNFDGKATFSNNWTGNYGGAIAVYDYANNLNFNGETFFVGNHASIFGGAIDVWGGAATVVFNGPTTFDGNYISYVYSDTNTFETPRHVNDQHVRGGAINVGYISSSGGGASVTFNGLAKFTGNYVLSQGTNDNNRNALGGAISVYGNNSPQDYRLRFNDAAIFENNWVNATSLTGQGNGGAIYYDSQAAELTLSSGTIFRNNYAKTHGGAIYLQSGEINLNADSGDIIFQGNRHGVVFNGNNPDTSSGTPNAIYLGSGGNLNLTAADGQAIHFHDPIASVAGSTVTVTKSGAGEVIFYGGTDGDYDSNIQANTVVAGGLFTLQDGVAYGDSGYGAFRVQSGGTVRGGDDSELRSKTLVVESGGALGGTGGDFTVNSPSITMQSGSRFTGSGQLSATSDIAITGTVTADIASDTLSVQRSIRGTGGINKTGAGTFSLGATAAYTGATTVSGGTLTASVANAYQDSDSVTVAAGGTLDLQGLEQTARNLSGAGSITLGAGGELTAVKERNTVFSGSITGGGSLVATGSGSLRLEGASTYTGGTSLTGGTLIAGNARALGTGAVTSLINTSLVYDIVASGTAENQFTLAGALEKTGTGTLTLTNSGSSAGAVTLSAGGLTFAQDGIFSAASYSSIAGGTTSLTSTANLEVAGLFSTLNTSALEVAIGDNDPAITADRAQIGGTLRVTGLAGSQLQRAGALDNYLYTVIQTANGITGNFSQVDLGAASSPVDYLSVTGGLRNDDKDYAISLGLSWYAAAARAHGTFTLVGMGDTFTVDVPLDDRGDVSSDWNGRNLTKRGQGTLVLDAENGYSGTTAVEAGTPSLTADNAIGHSSSVAVSSGATLATNGTSQTLANLTGAGFVNADGALTLLLIPRI